MVHIIIGYRYVDLLNGFISFSWNKCWVGTSSGYVDLVGTSDSFQDGPETSGGYQIERKPEVRTRRGVYQRLLCASVGFARGDDLVRARVGAS
jgi:hypothetical protein